MGWMHDMATESIAKDIQKKIDEVNEDTNIAFGELEKHYIIKGLKMAKEIADRG